MGAIISWARVFIRNTCKTVRSMFFESTKKLFLRLFSPKHIY